eukprot:symbB.v1.2.001936.t1/scaffold55.1/size374282/18
MVVETVPPSQDQGDGAGDACEIDVEHWQQVDRAIDLLAEVVIAGHKQEAQALASELHCHIMSLGQNVVLGGKVDIDNESSKEECQQAPRLASMAIAVMAVSQRLFWFKAAVLCILSFKACLQESHTFRAASSANITPIS